MPIASCPALFLPEPAPEFVFQTDFLFLFDILVGFQATLAVLLAGARHDGETNIVHLLIRKISRMVEAIAGCKAFQVELRKGYFRDGEVFFGVGWRRTVGVDGPVPGKEHVRPQIDGDQWLAIGVNRPAVDGVQDVFARRDEALTGNTHDGHQEPVGGDSRVTRSAIPKRTKITGPVGFGAAAIAIDGFHDQEESS